LLHVLQVRDPPRNECIDEVSIDVNGEDVFCNHRQEGELVTEPLTRNGVKACRVSNKLESLFLREQLNHVTFSIKIRVKDHPTCWTIIFWNKRKLNTVSFDEQSRLPWNRLDEFQLFKHVDQNLYAFSKDERDGTLINFWKKTSATGFDKLVLMFLAQLPKIGELLEVIHAPTKRSIQCLIASTNHIRS
jgi:hypothetical protein